LIRFNAFFEKEWPAYRQLIESQESNPFKQYDPVKISDH